MKEREPQYPPEFDQPETYECPVCKGPNVEDDEVTPLYKEDPSFCCEACLRKYSGGLYAPVTLDDLYVGDGEDGGHVAWAEGPKGWYISIVIDCNTASFVETHTEDDGPYPTERDAAIAGIGAIIEWCCENNVEIESCDASAYLPKELKNA